MIITRNDRNVNLKKHLPEFLTKDEELKVVLDVESKEHRLSIEATEDLFDQLFLDTATWGLVRWEKLLNLFPLPTDTYEMRRNRILLNLQRKKTSTVSYMEKLVLRYMMEGSKSKLIEQNSLYRFKIALDGIPSDFKGLREAIEIYKPAHLAYSFEFFVSDAIDELKKISDRADFQIMLKYEDQIPYGGTNNQAYSYELIYPFEYRPERDFDIDEIRAGIEFNFEDRYEALIEYGAFDYGHNAIYGGFTALPLDSNLNLQIGLDLADTPKEIADRAGELVITHTFHYGENAVYGEFGYGEQVMTEEIAGGLELTREGAIEKWRRLM